jgi:CelD/BcsL family acetyltransferase involved in cellulose biosynthesis
VTSPHPFAAPEWSRIWWEIFGRGELVRAPTPLVRTGRTLSFVGGVELTDYPGPALPAEAITLAAWLRAADLDWKELDGRFVQPEVAEVLVDGFAATREPEKPAAVLALPSDWSSYVAALSARERHELGRKRRRLRREYPEARLRTATAETLERDLAAFVKLHRLSPGRKGRFMEPRVAEFFARIACAFLARGELRLDVLELGGRPVAAMFGFELERAFYLYNSAYDPAAARLSPGIVLISWLIERAIDRRLAAFDFLRGAERYKLALGAELRALERVRLLA